MKFSKQPKKKKAQSTRGAIGMWWDRFILSPACNTGLWVAALFWGGYVSLYGEKMLNLSWPEGWPWEWNNHSPNGHAITAVVIFVILAYSFSTRSRALQEDDEKKLQTILSSPPDDFLEYFSSQYDGLTDRYELYEYELAEAEQKVYMAKEAALDAKDEGDEKEQAQELIKQAEAAYQTQKEKGLEDIRQSLVVIINLVNKWDSRNRRGTDVIYRANIMQVFWNEDEEQVKLDKLQEMAMNYYGGAPSEVSGFVALMGTELTTTTETVTPDPDEERVPIAFAFTKPNRDKEYLWPNLLGAPTAVVNGRYSYVADVNEIVKQYGNNKEAIRSDRKVKEYLETYYEKNKVVAHSLLSVPIKSALADRKVKWVVNIYRNQDGLLFKGDKVAAFLHIIHPILVLIRKQLYLIPND